MLFRLEDQLQADEFLNVDAHAEQAENEIAQALSTEQARWVDLNARLDELERPLGPAPR